MLVSQACSRPTLTKMYEAALLEILLPVSAVFFLYGSRLEGLESR
jgi:hypothetical protein